MRKIPEALAYLAIVMAVSLPLSIALANAGEPQSVWLICDVIGIPVCGG